MGFSVQHHFRVPRSPASSMIRPVGGSPPAVQTLNFLGPITARVHTEALLCYPGYDETSSPLAPLIVCCPGRSTSAAAMASAMKASLQAAMGTTIRNCFALFLEPGDHSFYLNDMLTLTDAQAPGGLPAQTLLEETMAYVTPRLRWNGRTVIFTFSMGGQIWRKVIEWQSLYGLRGIHFTSAPRLNYSSGGPFNGSTAAEFREVWGEDPDNPFPADPVSNARYIANSPQKIVEVNSAAIVSAIAAGTFGLRASVGADDNTKIGHHAFIDNVLTPAGIACASPADYVGVDHNLALVLAADATAIYAFLESRL